MRLQKALCLLAVILPISLHYGLKAEADEKATPPGEFEGKYLLVNNKGPSASYLEKVQLKKLGDSFFLVGIAIDIELKDVNWQKGLQVWVAVNEIAEITLFHTKADIIKAAKLFHEKAEKN